MSIEHGEALIDGFWVEVVSKTVLVCELISEHVVAIPVCTAEHQARKKFVADGSLGDC